MENDSVSLKEHLEDRIEASREIFDAKITALESIINKTFEMNNTAIKKAEDAVNFRLEGMNEFRAQMKDQQATFMPVLEFKAYQKTQDAERAATEKATQTQFTLLKERMNDLDTVQKIVATKASMPMVWIMGAGAAVGLILSIISLLQKWLG